MLANELMMNNFCIRSFSSTFSTAVLGVGVPHAKVAQASSSGPAASTAHGSQAPAAYQGSNNRHHSNNSPNAPKGQNSEAYLPPALRNQNQHGIPGNWTDEISN